MVAAITDYASSMLGLHKLTAGYHASNIASGRALEAVGFTIEGRQRDHFLVDGIWVDGVRLARFAPGTTA